MDRDATSLKRIAILTSGGDVPGMNAAIRAVTRQGIELGLGVLGVRRGYQGLIDGDFVPLDRRSVGGILGRGGTLLDTARSAEFKTADGQERAMAGLRARGIEGVVVIGGNGSQAGSLALSRRGFPVVGIASTIDNDLADVDITIGVDTALNTIVEAIDRLRDTATSHHRAFVVEVMGRDSGYLALSAAVAAGAELALIPEFAFTTRSVAAALRAAYQEGKPHFIAVLVEGTGLTAEGLCEALRNADPGFESRPVVLGHVQRGGSPSVFDRLLATRLGVAAAQALAAGEAGFVLGPADGQIARIPFEDAIRRAPKVDLAFYTLATALAR